MSDIYAENHQLDPQDEDFCIIHGYDHMKSDRGPIPYCAACDAEQQQETER